MSVVATTRAKRLRSLAVFMTVAIGIFVVGCSSGVPAGAPSATASARPAEAYRTPSEIGADFEEDGPNMQLEPEQFVPALGREEAERLAVQNMTAGFGLPTDMGIESLIVKKSTTALFSGINGLGLGARVGPWDVHDREVWVVVLADLPISLPCGPTVDSCKGVHPAQLNLILDSRTGEVLAGSLTGGGPRSDKWLYSGIMGRIEATQIANRPSQPTPTPISELPATPTPGMAKKEEASATPTRGQWGTPPAGPPPTVQPVFDRYPVMDCGTGFPFEEKWGALIRRLDDSSVLIVLMRPTAKIEDIQTCLGLSFELIDTWPSSAMMGNATPPR